MRTIKTNVPETLKEVQNNETITKSEAYKVSNEINQKDPAHHAKVENGELKVQQVLKG